MVLPLFFCPRLLSVICSTMPPVIDFVLAQTPKTSIKQLNDCTIKQKLLPLHPIIFNKPSMI